MKKFLKKLIYFTVPYIVIAIIIELSLRSMPNIYKYKNQYLDENSNRIEKLFLGTSHVYSGINPEFINGNAFNAALTLQTIDIDYEIIKKYKNNWNNLKYIIIPIDYFTLFADMSDFGGRERIKNYNIYYHMHLTDRLSDYSEFLNTDLKKSIKRIFNYYIINKLSICFFKLGFINDVENHKQYQSLYNRGRLLGFGACTIESHDLVRSGKVKALIHTFKDLSKLGKNISIIQKIISFAKRRNIKVIFYTSPAYKTYVSNLDKKQLDITINTITKIVKEKDNCYYFNLLEDTIFHVDDFADSDHLNPKGAKKLSLKIDSLINSIESLYNSQ